MADTLADLFYSVGVFIEEYFIVFILLIVLLVSYLLSLAWKRRKSQIAKNRAIASISGTAYQIIYGDVSTPKNQEGYLLFLKFIQDRLAPYRLSFEFKITKSTLECFVWIPTPLEEVVLRLAHEHIPDLYLKKIDQETIYPVTYSNDLILQSIVPANPFEPILESENVEGDFTKHLCSLASVLEPGESIVVQMQCTTPHTTLLQRFTGHISILESGEPVPTIKKSSNFFIEILSEIFKIFTTLPEQAFSASASSDSPTEATPAKELSEEELAHVNVLKDKQNSLLFTTTMSLCIAGISQDRWTLVGKNVTDLLEHYTKGTKNSLTITPISKPAESFLPIAKRRPWSSTPLLLSNTELFSFLKFPNSVEDAKLHITGKALLQSIPANLQFTEYNPALLKIGQISKQGQHLTVGLSHEDFRHNYLIAGRPKQGKSTLATQLVLHQFHQHGKSIIFDSRGNITKMLLEQLFQQKKKVIVLDFHDEVVYNSFVSHPFNTSNALKKVVLEVFAELFQEQMGKATGPVFDFVVERVVSTVCARKGILYDIPYLLLDEGFRRHYLEGLLDPSLITFWNQEYPKVARQIVEQNSPLCSLQNPIYDSKAMQALFGRRVPQRTLETVLTNYDVVIFQTAALSLLERKVVTNGLLLELATLLETRTIASHTMVAIEDAQVALTNAIAPLFSQQEASLLTGIFCTEMVSTLPKSFFKVLSQQASHRIFFNLINEEHEAMMEFDPVFEKNILTLLEPYHAYTKLVVNKNLSRLFLMKSLPLEQADLLQDYFRNFFKQQ